MGGQEDERREVGRWEGGKVGRWGCSLISGCIEVFCLSSNLVVVYWR